VTARQWQTLLFTSLGLGVIWAFVIFALLAAGFSLLEGTGLMPSSVQITICGLIAGMWGLIPIRLRTRGLIAGFALGISLLFHLLATDTPFQNPEANPLLQSLGALLGSLLLVIVLVFSFRTLGPGVLNRRRWELCILSSLQVFGFVFFTVIVVLPFYVMLMTSLKSQQALLMNPLDLMPNWRQDGWAIFRSYVELFRDFNFGRYIGVSAIVSLATVALTLLFAIPGAYAVARLRFQGRKVLSRSILLIYLVPAIVLVIPLYVIFSQLGLRNSLLGLLIVYPATTLPVALYMLQGYFRGIPPELEEAALMDGCSRMVAIRQVTMPLSIPALASVGLYVFMIAWNEFLFAFMFLDDPSIFTLPRGVVSLNSSEVPRQHLMAGAVISTVPILILFLWAERFLVKGLTAGSVKG
jgi:multiple sugar transport system permease protein